jgi:ABC-type nitrate/sulfonate/bicarbonate transport system substrate-binding protein
MGALSLGGLLAGSGMAATRAAEQKVKFQLRWLHEVSWAGYYIAIEKGYYRDEGINVNIVPGGPNLDVQQIVSGGGAPVGLGITDAIIRARIAGAPLRVFGAQWQQTPAGFITFTKDGIKTPKDLSDKRIATTTNGDPLVRALFANAGLPNDKWTFVNSGFDPSPLVQGQSDAFHGFCTGQGLSLQLQGYKVNCLTYDKFGYTVYDGCLVTTDDVIEKNEDMLVGFLRATIKGWEYNNRHLEEGTQLTMKKYGKGLDLKLQRAQNKAQAPFMTSPLTNRKGLYWMSPSVWTKTINFLATSKSISKKIPATDVMTTDILKKAYGGKTRLLGS